MARAGAAPSAEMIVHAWIDAGPGVRCGWCAATAYPGDGGEGAAMKSVQAEFRVVVQVGEWGGEERRVS